MTARDFAKRVPPGILQAITKHPDDINVANFVHDYIKRIRIDFTMTERPTNKKQWIALLAPFLPEPQTTTNTNNGQRNIDEGIFEFDPLWMAIVICVGHENNHVLHDLALKLLFESPERESDRINVGIDKCKIPIAEYRVQIELTGTDRCKIHSIHPRPYLTLPAKAFGLTLKSLLNGYLHIANSGVLDQRDLADIILDTYLNPHDLRNQTSCRVLSEFHVLALGFGYVTEQNPTVQQILSLLQSDQDPTLIEYLKLLKLCLNHRINPRTTWICPSLDLKFDAAESAHYNISRLENNETEDDPEEDPENNPEEDPEEDPENDPATEPEEGNRIEIQPAEPEDEDQNDNDFAIPV